MLQDPAYGGGLADLESHYKAWGSRMGKYSTEDLAVAALLWDIVDGDPDAEWTSAVNEAGVHWPVVYPDAIQLPLGELWRVLTGGPFQLSAADSGPTVFALHRALSAQPQFAPLTIDLDYDGENDISQLDALFLVHGFFPIQRDQLPGHTFFHYDVANARIVNPDGPRNADVGKSSHERFAQDGVVSDALIPRYNLEPVPEANLEILVHDARGRPIDGADLELTLDQGESQRTIEQVLGSGEGSLVHLELPASGCDAGGEGAVDVTVRARVNGYPAPEAPTFDSCTYLEAVSQATDGKAMSLSFSFPEDSTPPVTTVTSIFPGYSEVLKSGGARITQGYPFTLELSCEDPLAGDFASGCAGIQYSLDGTPFAPYEREIGISSPGMHTFVYTSLDRAGNGESEAVIRLGIQTHHDTDPPVTSLSATPSEPPVDGYTPGFWTVALSCTDPNGGVGPECRRSEYSIDDSAFATYAGEFVVSGPGSHVVRYRSVDWFNNVESARSVTLRVQSPDTTPPLPQVRLVPSNWEDVTGDWDVMGVWTFSALGCRDDLVGPVGQAVSGCAYSEYSLDGAPFAAFAGPVVISELGRHVIRARSFDVAGNEGFNQIEFGVLPLLDTDDDGIPDHRDNCILHPNDDQSDTDGDGFGNRCDPDFNQNGIVDSNDASRLKALLGSELGDPIYARDYDLDGDEAIDGTDMDILRSMFRKPPGPTGTETPQGE